jgi:hypothetical protein
MSADLAAGIRNALIAELEELHDSVRQVATGLTDAELWTRPLEPGNSIGHLVLHLTGNLNYYVGAQLGGSGYVRDRDREFTEAALPPRATLLANFDAAAATFRRVVGGLSAEQLAGSHPEPRLSPLLKGLVHLVSHFALHRGQMSYLARLVKK